MGGVGMTRPVRPCAARLFSQYGMIGANDIGGQAEKAAHHNHRQERVKPVAPFVKTRQ